ncbi:DUF5908 family protein [Candidatus Cardinium hertigii]|uniref:Uncharacterized protein n=1 Tax=Candidatus Cardinium hertigii TaxID=247481 RepID=A0A2Z3L9T2_9BACT|nr:DUF5908 family protein [Candidatus Cardinium hertigii]AWN82119.1 hypothetical protein DK880_00814 [Candidatus Cardinium hertigii]
MPIKINELVIRVKVCETNKQEESAVHRSGHLVSEQQKLDLIQDCLYLLEEREVR